MLKNSAMISLDERVVIISFKITVGTLKHHYILPVEA